ncbi:MAG TPA: serine hydrolase domain-containing protein [Candidatus Limnocylindria bacterium]|nr:serine hydrolase domain-containing protein [Candidatus Limnocylindria bacterium]
MDASGVTAVLERGVASGAFPGAVVLVARGGEIVLHEAVGFRSLEPTRTPMRRDTVFDLASLTKPLATTLAVMLLVREGKLRLDERVSRVIPGLAVHGKDAITIRHLLAHCSGLAAWRPFYEQIRRIEADGRPNFVATRGARDFVYEAVHRERPEHPPGTAAMYSDLGFILLGELVELTAHQTLADFCRARFYRPLGLQLLDFVDLTRKRRERLEPAPDAVAPTERCPWRGKILCGEVHDDNAWAMGGVAGHAGLFGNAACVHALLVMLRACARGEPGPLTAGQVREMWRRDDTVPGSTWALGWDTPSPEGSSAGSRISPNAVGHLGFTGTSVWLDLERDCHVVLLTNRVHPTRRNEGIRDIRPQLHDAVFEALER